MKRKTHRTVGAVVHVVDVFVVVRVPRIAVGIFIAVVVIAFARG